MILSLLALVVGTVLIRFLHRIRRKLSGSDDYFSFSDFVVEDRTIRHRGFVWMAIPPLLGGAVLSFVPGSDAYIAAAAGFLAAFLGVWPVLQFPFHLLDEFLQPYWHKLRFLYFLFIGASTALAYTGFEIQVNLAPLTANLARSRSWQAFLDDVAANAVYDLAKYGVVSLLVFGGVYVNRRRNSIGMAAAKARDEKWQQEMDSGSTS